LLLLVAQIIVIKQPVSKNQIFESTKYVREGLEFVRAKKFEEALPLFLKANSLNPSNPKIISMIGQSYKSMGNCKEAMPYLIKVIEVDKYQYNTYGVIGDCHRKLGNNQEAVIYFDKLLELNPEQYHGAFILGEIYLKQNELEISKEYFNKFKKIINGLQPQMLTDKEKHKIRTFNERANAYINEIDIDIQKKQITTLSSSMLPFRCLFGRYTYP